MKRGLWTGIIILIIIVFSIYILSKNGGNENEQLAKCIASKSTLYIQTGCFACQKQEGIFGETYKYLNTVDCSVEGDVCLTNEIMATPTWLINGEKYVGYIGLDNLKELTGCE